MSGCKLVLAWAKMLDFVEVDYTKFLLQQRWIQWR